MNSKLKKFFCICGIVTLIGFVCTIVGIAGGGFDDLGKVDDRFKHISFGKGDLKIEKSNILDNVKNLSIDYDGGDVIFKEGHEYSITVRYLDHITEKPIFRHDGNTLYVTAKYLKDEELYFGLFDDYEDETTELIITYPKGRTFENINIVADCDVQIDALQSKRTSFKMADYGDCYIQNSNLGETVISGEISNIEMDNVITANTKLPAIEGGDIEIDGVITGTLEIRLTGGDLDFVSRLPIDDYKIELSYEDAKVEINNETYDSEYSSGKQVIGNPKAKNVIKLFASEGADVEMKFGL